jgi:hypothetical protein
MYIKQWKKGAEELAVDREAMARIDKTIISPQCSIII